VRVLGSFHPGHEVQPEPLWPPRRVGAISAIVRAWTIVASLAVHSIGDATVDERDSRLAAAA
jgi:hypothetical protein